MDNTNVPNLLSLPYLGAVKSDDPIYGATAQSYPNMNPYYFKGDAAEGGADLPQAP